LKVEERFKTWLGNPENVSAINKNLFLERTLQLPGWY